MTIRQQLIGALDYPRSIVSDIIEARNCPHCDRFDPGSALCHDCAINGECHWLTWLESCDDLQAKPLHTLVASLRYGVDLVKAVRGDDSHDVLNCSCEECAWTRMCEGFIAEFDAALPGNPYRPSV